MVKFDPFHVSVFYASKKLNIDIMIYFYVTMDKSILN